VSLLAWIVCYLGLAAFLAWVAWGRGLDNLAGGVMAMLLLDRIDPLSDRGLRRAAVGALLFATVWFVVGLVVPEWRWGLWLFR
jgi:hypothetical protein